MRTGLLSALMATAIVCVVPAIAASPTTFTYQGHLAQDGDPAEGAYEFEVRLLDNLGVQIGMTQTASEIVSAGAFSMELDFGTGAFDGNTRYLEISVRSVVDGGAYTALSPNQLVTSTPVAQFALSGNEGPQGVQGDEGSAGSQGDPGADGDDGVQGDQGLQGDQGIQGLSGADGAQGTQGDPGTPGDSHWSLFNSSTYFDTGNVGIGTDSPNYPLHVETSEMWAMNAFNNATTGYATGVYAATASTGGRGVNGLAFAISGDTFGVVGESRSSVGVGVYGYAEASAGSNYGVRGHTNSSSGYAGYFSGGRNYFEGKVGVGKTNPQYSLHVEGSLSRTVSGVNTITSGNAYGVYGQSNSTNGRGVTGSATAASGATYGVRGISSSIEGIGVYGLVNSTTGTNYGVRGHTNSGAGYAGYFTGGRNYFQGKVGVGTSSPSDQLHIAAPAGEDAFRVQTDGLTRIRVNANGGVSLGGNSTIIGAGDVYIAGNLGIGTNAPTFDLSVSGTAAKSGGGSWAVFSDQRLKKNITSMTGSLDTITALRPVNFEYKSEDHFSYLPGVQRGFIAQEVQKVIPQWVNTADDGFFYLDQIGYEALIVDAIQELRAEKNMEIEQLQRENTELKARLDRIEHMLRLVADR